jgi:hypothetical protein
MKTGDFVLDILHEVEDYIEDMRVDDKKEILSDLIRNLVTIMREVQ